MESAMRRHVRLVLDRAGGDEEAAAQLLGITREELGRHVTPEPIDPSPGGA